MTSDKNILYSELTLKKYPNESIIELVIDRLKTDSDKGCLIDCTLNRRTNKRQVLESSLNFGHYLITECEVKSGDIVLFVKNNSDCLAIALIGVLTAGAVYCSIPEHSAEREIRDVTEVIKPTILICSGLRYALIKEATKNSLSIKRILAIEEQTIDTKSDNVLNFDMIFNKVRESDIGLPRAGLPDDPIIITMSSGSTGRPKAILRTNRNFLTEIASFQHPQIFPLTAHDIFLSSGLCHISGQRTILACINTGAQLALIRIDEKHDDTFLAIHKYGITSALLIPTQLNFLSRNREVYNKCFIASLRDVFSGSAALSEATYNSIVDNFNIEKFRRGYGMSEMGTTLMVYNKDSKNLSNKSTIGKLFPGAIMKVIDNNGNALGPNEHGQFCFKGEHVTPGYLNNDEENAKAFTTDDFFKSGDLGYYDENGFIYFVSRLKEIINVEGVVVAPAELESILLQNEEIVNAAVIGIKDQDYGEIPLTFVQLVKGSELTPKQIQEFVDSKVNYFKKLRGGVRIVQKFPLSPHKKINKTELKKMFLNSF